VSSIVSFLRRPSTALAIIAFVAVWTTAGAWAPWTREQGGVAPTWAAAIGLGHPFTAWPFLAGVALLFASTLACTWGRRRRIVALRSGELPPGAQRLPQRPADVRAFLLAHGFRGDGPLLVRNGLALWGGWVLHVGLLLLVAAVLLQQARADGGVFDLTQGEAARLDAPGVVFGRERAPFAPEPLPPVEVRLEQFDPALHQPGYAPDRRSRLSLAAPGEPPRVAELDRAAGVRFGGIEIFQAIPTGLSIVLEVPGMGARAIRLAEEAPRRAAAAVTDPAGRPARFVVDLERDAHDPAGTGRLLIWLEQGGQRTAIAPGAPFPFGGVEARALAIARWGRFTWTQTPALGAVWLAFVVLLVGCTLLAFPAGVARLGAPDGETAAALFVTRGGEVISTEWDRAGAPADALEA